MVLGPLKLTITGILGPRGAHLSDLRDLLKEKVESGTRGWGSLTGSAWEMLNHLVVLKPRITSPSLGSTPTGIPPKMGGALISRPHLEAPGILFLNSVSWGERIRIALDPYRSNYILGKTKKAGTAGSCRCADYIKTVL